MRKSKLRVRECALLALCALPGCKSEAQRAAPASASASAAAAGSGSPLVSDRDAGSVVPVGFDVSAVRGFVDRWVAAQNEHDFGAYSASYAVRFSGTKRVGHYSKIFDRESWLRDRRPMFRDGVVVRATDLRLTGSVGAVRAVFTQDFAAPGFHDVGKKELFLVAQASGFAISREEMLESQLAEPAPLTESAVLAFDRDGPVLESGFRAILSGTPRLLARGTSASYDVALPVSPGALSEATRAWLGRAITVYAKRGAQCQGVVTRFEVRVKSEPHFGMRQTWEGEGGATKAPSTQIAKEIWAMAREDERFVVGVLDHECHGVWATTHASSFTAAEAPPATLRALALTAFKALPAYRELQARFARDPANPVQSWETVDGVLNVVQLSASAEARLVVVAARGGVGCGGFGGNLSAIWKVSGPASTPELKLRGTFQDYADLLQVNGALDQNADGALELLAGPDVFADEVSVLRVKAIGYERQVLLRTSVWDCGC